MDLMYIEMKNGICHIMREICHSKQLNHYTRYSITTRKTSNEAWKYMSFLSEKTSIAVKPLY